MSYLKAVIPAAPFITFCRDGLLAKIDFKDGKLDYSGDLPISDAARMLFEQLGRTLPADWMDPATARTEARNAALEEAARHLEEYRAPREEYGHAKAAVMLDAEAIRALIGTDPTTDRGEG
ncbi:hypothetical protein EZH22_24715 [Xanthobacter dioxanivorans]|uniref:Uncharacterized protein n=1 Tax=Xanthobacter dioxanivorans TaxID=2528964 RepID=A0A974PM49_9HYPH|nr:hypothetical protein [Xanthobacter dioxanivorans]QRG06152.1 hypothetical protein EZH22_24715 [Xanthobacter dioxanivorans]